MKIICYYTNYFLKELIFAFNRRNLRKAEETAKP